MHGWAGRVLDVNLTTGEIKKLPLDMGLAKMFLGGRGLNAITLYRELKANTDPLSPANVLLFGVGPLNGTLSPGSGRYNVTSKSPLTGGFGDANCGGYWGAELKFAGYDQIIIRGKADSPVYLWIDDDDVEIRDASHLWGKATDETDRLIKEELGDPRIHINYIGPAGERLVKVANVMSDLYRAAGRTGMGCVMGSKNLKAIAVRGTRGVKVAHPDALQEHVYESYQTLYSDWFARLFSQQGSACLVEIYNENLGALTFRNNQETFKEPRKMGNISGKAFAEKYLLKHRGCFSCPLHCASFFRFVDPRFGDTYWGKAEFATLTNFSTRVGVDSADFSLYMCMLADKWGIDIISLGGIIAFALECYEKGIISQRDTGGLELTWGNEAAIEKLAEDIAFRKSELGNLLAEGVRRASQQIGRGADRYALHTKGLEHLEVDPRGLQAWGLGFAVSTRGADHLRALPVFEYTITPEKAKAYFGTEKAADRFSVEGKGKMVKWFEELRAFADSLEICKYITRTGLLEPEPALKILNSVTGLSLQEEDAFRIGERIVNVERSFNAREGFTRKDDTLPQRFLEEPVPTGPAKGQVNKLEEMLDQYYETRGWDNNGVPEPGKLKELGLDFIARDMEKI